MKILLISGHGAGDPGAVSQFGKEADDNLYESFEIYKKEVHSSPGNAMFPGFFFA